MAFVDFVSVFFEAVVGAILRGAALPTAADTHLKFSFVNGI